MAWIQIGPDDPDSIWIETEEVKENPEELDDPEIRIETEEDKENETEDNGQI